MDRDLEVLTALLLDPCLTADEALREATARRSLRDIEKANPTSPADPSRPTVPRSGPREPR
jgi:hypothetical protein